MTVTTPLPRVEVCAKGPDLTSRAGTALLSGLADTLGLARGLFRIAPLMTVGEAVARPGHGGIVRVDGFAALPRRKLAVADSVLR